VSAAAAINDTTEPLDRALLEGYVAGDRQAFRLLFDRLHRELYAVARRYFRGAFDQEEAVQEIWLQLYRARERFDLSRHETFTAWARQLARNRCIDMLRAKRRTQEVPVAEPHAADEPRQERSMADKQVAHTLGQFVAGLDAEQRRFFTLCFVEERPHEQIAHELGVSIRRSKYLKKKLLARLMRSARLRAAGRE